MTNPHSDPSSGPTLNHFLAQCGITSRRHAVELVRSGQIFLNGVVATAPAYRVAPTDVIEYQGKTLSLDTHESKDYVYILLNKPVGYECTRPSKFSTKTIYDLVNLPQYRLFSVGRLDKNSEGMIILTNDGSFTQELTHPSYELTKTYVVKTKYRMSEADLLKIRAGIMDEGELLRVKTITPRASSAYAFDVVLTEGKKREIRRIIRACGNQTVILRRVGIGSLFMRDLPRGQWRYLEQNDLKLILSNPSSN